MNMSIFIEKSNGNQIIKLSEEILKTTMKETLDETHDCMRRICSEDNAKVIFDRSIQNRGVTQEKKKLIDELNDFLVIRCEKVATLFDSQKEKAKYNYKFKKKGKLMKTKGFTNNEIDSVKSFLDY